MIHSILLEFLAEGSIPVYETATDVNYHTLDFGDPLDLYTLTGQWRPKRGRHRITIPLNIDTDNNAVFTHAPHWVNQAQALPGNGTLIFVVRTATIFEDGTTLVLAGMAYSERHIEGAVPLGDTNPADLIVQLLHNNRDHAIVRDALEQRDGEIRENRRYDLMYEEIRRIEKRKERRAVRRAEKLLDAHLTHKQRRELKKKKLFHVRGQDGNLYQITHYGHQNVFQIEGGRRIRQFCAVSSGQVPIADLLLAQKFLIESDIAHFLKIANKWDIKEGVRDRVIDLGLAHVDRIMEFREALDDAAADAERYPRRVPPPPRVVLERLPMPELPEMEIAV